jgi:hypothetical protein
MLRINIGNDGLLPGIWRSLLYGTEFRIIAKKSFHCNIFVSYFHLMQVHLP